MSSSPVAVTPARIEFDVAGMPHAPDFGDVYHSVDGGPAQSRHVFLAGNDLPGRWRGRDRFAILETGFGLGLNFLCTASAYLADAQASGRLHYVSVEKHPASIPDLARAHAHWPEFGALAAEVRRLLPPAIGGFHRIELAGGRVSLTLLYGDARALLAELAPRTIDAFFLDGFAPEKNPQMWSPEVFATLARLARGTATAATWSVAAVVRSGLQAAGFALARRPGFGRKREMLVASLATGSDFTSTPVRRALVIGAGVAGCWTAHALTRRGWDVTLIERRAEPALEGSGNPVGVLLPPLNLADNDNARLGRAAFLYATRALARFPQDAGIHGAPGLLQVALARDPAAAGTRTRRRTGIEQAQRMQQILARHAFPTDYVRWMEADEGARRAGTPVGGPGWWIEAGGWVAPRRLCVALLDEASTGHLHTRFGTTIARLERTSGGWRALDADDEPVATAPTVIVANAHAAAALGLGGLPRLIAVRGQITYLPAAASPRLDCVLCGDGYAAPLPGGGLCVGATFEPGSTALDVRRADHAQNLARAQRMLPACAAGVSVEALAGRTALRTATADRLPACGPLGEPESGLWLLAGLGARGLVWAPLCAEVLAARLEQDPAPVEASLVHAMRPARDAAAPG